MSAKYVAFSFITAIFLLTEKIIQFYWRESLFASYYQFMICAFIAAILIDKNLNKIAGKSMLMFYIFKMLIVGVYYSLLGALLSNIMILPFVVIAGESKWVMLYSAVLFIIFVVAGIAHAFSAGIISFMRTKGNLNKI